MTDVTVAPASAPNPTPQAQTSQGSGNPSEVVVNQNPTSSPSPIGSQAPPAPPGDFKGSEHRTPSRREAIEAAFDRANKPLSKSTRDADRPVPKAAEAKPGHNQPPEETPRLNLKKRPDDQAQPRGDRGQFAPREQNQNGKDNSLFRQAGTNGAQSGQIVRTLPEHAPYRNYPVRISESAKRDWDKTPETVRADAHRWQAEFAKAYNFYKSDFEAFKPIKHFHQMALQHGTTLEKALNNYVGIENKLRNDPIAALDTIIQNLGLTDPQTKQRIGLRDIAYTVLSQTPEQLRQIQQGNQQHAAAHQIGSLHQEIAGLKNTLNQMHTQQQFTYTRSAVDQFADTHPRFDELGDLIEQELKLGFPLDQAYSRAELLRPATHAAQTRTTPAQTRPPDRSIYGSPDVAPSNGASRRPKEASASPRDAVRNAISRMNGHV